MGRVSIVDPGEKPFEQALVEMAPRINARTITHEPHMPSQTIEQVVSEAMEAAFNGPDSLDTVLDTGRRKVGPNETISDRVALSEGAAPTSELSTAISFDSLKINQLQNPSSSDSVC